MPNATKTPPRDGTTAGTTSKPNPLAMLFHVPKTFTLVGSVLSDARVHWLSKAFFVTCILALVAALFFPEAAAEMLGLGIPGVGWAFDIMGLPVDATIDWVALSVAAFNLLRLFPSEIVGEHYDRLFRR
ncbi:MAG: hypothetical protein OJF49_003779 [Ktedonobacterales bacterium]|nr:MAG: hypothetical protein OJF49_003779 [Ktedonobacterales bacterium]